MLYLFYFIYYWLLGKSALQILPIVITPVSLAICKCVCVCVSLRMLCHINLTFIFKVKRFHVMYLQYTFCNDIGCPRQICLDSNGPAVELFLSNIGFNLLYVIYSILNRVIHGFKMSGNNVVKFSSDQKGKAPSFVR